MVSSELLSIGLLAFATFTISAWLTSWLCQPGSRLYVLDHPNERSLHSHPTPRTGGIAIVVAILVSATVFIHLSDDIWREFAQLGIAVLLVAVVSFVDDRKPLPIGLRLAVHLFAAFIVTYHAGIVAVLAVEAPVPAMVVQVLVILYLVWMLNLYNFMDGMDGFAGGMTLIGFGTYAVLGWRAEQEVFAGLSLLVACSASGFLLFNFPRARIFMGDIGSSVLGLLAGVFSVWGASKGIFTLWIGVLVFLPFVMDSTITLARRLIKREKFWQAHKNHYYQRLVQVGWGHRRTVLVEYLMMLICGGGAIAAQGSSIQRQLILFSLISLFFIGFFRFVRILELRAERGRQSIA